MTDGEALRHVLAEAECLRNRLCCNKNCTGCKYWFDPVKRYEAFKYVEDVLKSRNPELYFLSELDILRGGLQEYADKCNEIGSEC